ncbi:MAG: peptidyl-prolyl cis-trans isomerase [Hyphomicrobiales bacterium]|jgi:peptidyl-prolyl cis-trans isomerase C|nr:peptidyl-prolyl cis-trans isomerase [Hyphomicrobiales bacterium]
MKPLSLSARLGLSRATLLVSALVVVAALAFAVPLVRAQDDPVVARVNGTDIRQSDLTLAEEDLGGNIPQMTPEAKRDYLITFVGDMMLVAKAAEAKKFGDGDDFKRKLAYARTKLLMEQYLQSEAKGAVNEAAMKKVYDEAIGQMKKEPEVRARHILVETEDEAKAVVAELKKGADFAELAKSKSKDPGSADGGDLGYFTKDQMVPEFSEVAFKLDKGALSDPVKSQFGWHVIKVEDKRERQPPEYDKVKDQLENFLVRKSQSELITKLRAEGKIEKVEAPATTPAPAAPPAGQKK